MAGAAPITPFLGLNTAIWRSPAHTRPPINAKPASARNAPASLPVLCFAKPIMVGPKKPPLEPIPLISAIPAAADVPLRNFVGRHQKEARNTGLHIAMPTSEATRSSEWGNSAAPTQPAQPIARPSAAKPQRSSQRSDAIAAIGYTSAASRAMLPVISPVAALLVPSASRTSVGAQSA